MAKILFALTFFFIAVTGALAQEKVLAYVGDETITEKEVLRYVEPIIAAHAKQISDEQRDATRAKLVERRLNDLIALKLAILDARENLSEESIEKIVASFGDEFEKKMIPKMLQQYQAKSRDELRYRLAQRHISFENQKQVYIEDQLAIGWLSEQVKRQKVLTPEVDLKQAREQYLIDLKERYPVKIPEKE